MKEQQLETTSVKSPDVAWGKSRPLISDALEKLDGLYHGPPRVGLLRWACSAHEATNIQEWPELRDWPGGRLLTAFHRWFWLPVTTQTTLRGRLLKDKP